MAASRPARKVVRLDEEDRLLVEAAQENPARFGDLYEIHFEQVYAFIARRVRDRDIAEDLTSDVFHKALANLRTYEFRGAPFAAWLIRIASNAVADHSKRAARQVARPEEDPPDLASAKPEFDALERSARLFRLVNHLTDDQRHVIFKRFVEQKSIREIAQQLGRSEGAVKQLQLRAIHNLRVQMGKGHA
jgi:RNA polymerase sigma-70 factor (ECF subfamily)